MGKVTIQTLQRTYDCDQQLQGNSQNSRKHWWALIERMT